MMEGYLRKWVNIMYGWKPRYFILHDDILTFFDKKGGTRKGTVFVRISKITTVPEDPLRIIIHTGTHELHLRSENLTEMKEWYQALRRSQEASPKRSDLKNYHEKDIEAFEKKLTPEAKVIMQGSNLDVLKEKLSEIWVCQAEFDEVLSLIGPKVRTVPGTTDNLAKLEKLGTDLKYKVTECVNKIEEEKKKMMEIATKFGTPSNSTQSSAQKTVNTSATRDNVINLTNVNNANNANNNVDKSQPVVGPDDFVDEDGTVFQSFESDEDYDDDVLEGEEEKKEGEYQPPSRHRSGIFDSDIDPNTINLGKILGSENNNNLEKINPIIKFILAENPVFIKSRPIPKENYRMKMPHWLDLNRKMNVWAIVKDMVGKDLTKLPLPVWLNEPLSMLQKLTEQLEYSNLLDIASTKDDSCLRMAYIMGFASGYYAGTVGRVKKPFNPILGETFEYVPIDGAFRFVSEQVSHHPPISAGFADSPNFQWWGDTHLKTNFKGMSLDATTLGSCHCILKKYEDHYVYKRPITSVQNIIIGTMYVDNYGEMPFQNSKTGDTGLLTLKKRGWGDRGAYEMEGWVKDKTGKIRFTVSGKWNSHVIAVDTATKQEIRIWDRLPVPENYEQQFSFSLYTRQLNYLHEGLIPKLPATDSRFRPDQRALEYGLEDLAREEKFRLEEKQRARRKELQTRGETHKARFFKEIKDPITNEKSYIYTGGYWECRDKNDFGEVLDLFS